MKVCMEYKRTTELFTEDDISAVIPIQISTYEHQIRIEYACFLTEEGCEKLCAAAESQYDYCAPENSVVVLSLMAFIEPDKMAFSPALELACYQIESLGDLCGNRKYVGGVFINNVEARVFFDAALDSYDNPAQELLETVAEFLMAHKESVSLIDISEE